MKVTDIIKTPVLTEKTSPWFQANRYTFLVDARANKIEIKKAFETIFEVKVAQVNVMNLRSRKKRIGQYEGRTARAKKAIIQLQEGYSLDLFANEPTSAISKPAKEQKDGD